MCICRIVSTELKDDLKEVFGSVLFIVSKYSLLSGAAESVLVMDVLDLQRFQDAMCSKCGTTYGSVVLAAARA